MDIPKRLSGLSLFSGIGGIDVALDEWVRTDAYCEIDPYCQSVLLSRMQEGHLSKAPIWPDVRTLPFRELPKIDIIFGGFPCQDISIAGAGKGLAGERSGLFFEIVRLCREIRPSFIFLENVPAITFRGGNDVVGAIAALGYDCRWIVISAASVGALHRRERWFLLAYSKHYGIIASQDGGSVGESIAQGRQQQPQESEWPAERASSLPGNVANTLRPRLQEKGAELETTGTARENLFNGNVANAFGERLERQWNRTKCASEKQPMFTSSCNDGNTMRESGEQTDKETNTKQCDWEAWGEHTGQYWPFESREHWQEVVSSMGKCSHGLPFHVDRLKSLGNSVVPQQCRKAFEILMGIK